MTGAGVEGMTGAGAEGTTGAEGAAVLGSSEGGWNWHFAEFCRLTVTLLLAEASRTEARRAASARR